MKIVASGLHRLTEAERERYGEQYKWCTLGEWSCEWGARSCTIREGFLCDGSSGGPDAGNAWVFHDYLYKYAKWDDGTWCTRHEADQLMADVLKFERFRYYTFAFWLVRKFLSSRLQAAWDAHRRRESWEFTTAEYAVDPEVLHPDDFIDVALSE